jgi:hypothetical protein
MPTPPKPTLGLLKEILFLSGAIIFDLLKILLAFTDAALVIPVVGEGVFAIAQIFTWVLSVFEYLIIFGGLWLAGAYKGKRGATGVFLSAITAVVDLVPVLDDLPATTGSVLTIIIKCRIQDKADLIEYHKKQATAAKQKLIQSLKEQAAAQAAQNALSMRERALADSQRAL